MIYIIYIYNILYYIMCVYEERHDVKIARHIAEVPNNQKIKAEHGTCDLCILEKTMCKQLDIPNLSPDTHTYTNKPTPARVGFR